MEANSVHLKLFYFLCPFVSRKRGKEVKKLKKVEYLQNEKSFLGEIKNTFHSF